MHREVDIGDALAQFRALAFAGLEAANDDPREARFARAVGARRQHLNGVFKGRTACSLVMLARWVATWNAGGYPPVRLVVDGWVARIEAVATTTTYDGPTVRTEMVA